MSIESPMWMLWYGDGSSISSTESAWSDAPDQDVQALSVWNEHGPTLTYGVDEYRLTGEDSVKYGKWMNEDEWESLRLRIHGEVS